MPRDQDRRSSDRHRHRRTRSTSSSPEPYRERPRSRERRRRDSRGSDSRSRERDRKRRRYSYSSDGSQRDRSRSPRSQPSRRYGEEERRRYSGRRDEREDSYMKHAARSSPPADARRPRPKDDGRKASMKGHRPLPSQQDAFKGESTTITKGTPPAEKQKPNFSTTGRLAAESNTVTSIGGQPVVLKYHEPPEARKPPPSQAWRMYVFKGSEIMDTIELSQRSCWLIGREAAVVDLLVEHPSCSKQHAVIQFRYVEKRNEFGDKTARVRPYLIDLETANGTGMNGEQVPAGRYMELRDKDILKFAHSTREYVLQLVP
ncbi:hypothetical protein GJ744_012266 [Endocarpon pusillum]|uniref:FHA domain-containing protein n=1 Tax=Endocarpon pusillum TaxID=364733 RepID=A0A8H7ABJ2_9EURO|nr:hypothetical protein GJ744_012266 [Endocarpon pusillum]